MNDIFNQFYQKVTYAFCKEFASLLVSQVGSDGELPVMRIMSSIFDPNSGSGSGGSIAGVAKAFHRYALNYINALNYLETLRRHQEFCEFEKVNKYNFVKEYYMDSQRKIFHDSKQTFFSGVIRIQGVTNCNLQIS